MSASDLFSIAGKTALVTGGTRGIGKMIAEGFVEAGAAVYISSRKADACADVAAELSAKGTCIGIPADLSTEDGCRLLAEEMSSRVERLQVLVNNAGATWGTPLAEFDETAFEKVLALNVKGVFHLTKFLVPLLEASGTVGRAGPGHQHRLDRRHKDSRARDLRVLGQQGRRAPTHPSPGQATGTRHHRERHRPGTVRDQNDGGHAERIR